MFFGLQIWDDSPLSDISSTNTWSHSVPYLSFLTMFYIEWILSIFNEVCSINHFFYEKCLLNSESHHCVPSHFNLSFVCLCALCSLPSLPYIQAQLWVVIWRYTAFVISLFNWLPISKFIRRTFPTLLCLWSLSKFTLFDVDLLWVLYSDQLTSLSSILSV